MSPAVTGAAADGRRSSVTRVLVVGVGNTLRRDDGAGVAAAERMLADPRFVDVDVRTVYQLLPELAQDLAGCSLVVFVDADMRVAPGSVEVRRLEPDATAAGAAAVGPGGGTRAGAISHHFGPAELVALGRQLTGCQPQAVAVGVGVADVELGEGLSAAVAATLPRVLDTVLGLVGQYRSSAGLPRR